MIGLVFSEISNDAVILCPQFIKGQQSTILLIFLYKYCFANIHNSQDSRERGKLSF